ncbi:MAG: NnrU family protein [Proteobacteria bacterium]|nr:NnrU family protein [Pseudomonadota bacterium]
MALATLVLGLVLFLGIHTVPAVPPLRAALAGRLGENRYKGLFSAVSGIGLVLIAAGYAYAPRGEQLFAPSVGARHAALLVVPLAFILLAAANMKTHIRQAVRHPMLIGLGLWALVHLLANGHAKATLLFGAFLAYAALDLGSAVARGAVKQFTPQRKYDFMAVGGGIGLALLVLLFHRIVFGVAPVPWAL